jgi:hypothetical protein
VVKHYIEALCRQALDRLCPLVDLLAADPQVSQYLSREFPVRRVDNQDSSCCS